MLISNQVYTFVKIYSHYDKNITCLLKGAMDVIEEVAFANYFSDKLAFIDKGGNLFVWSVAIENKTIKYV